MSYNVHDGTKPLAAKFLPNDNALHCTYSHFSNMTSFFTDSFKNNSCLYYTHIGPSSKSVVRQNNLSQSKHAIQQTCAAY